jgi:hypothetical protein
MSYSIVVLKKSAFQHELLNYLSTNVAKDELGISYDIIIEYMKKRIETFNHEENVYQAK